jgi:type IV pilus assembly protein PilA
MKRRRREQGFSLPELMVVLAIIMLLVVLAVPRYKKSKQVAEDAAAQANLKSIHTAQEAHRITHGEYAPNFQTLAGAGRSLPVADGGGGDAGGDSGGGGSNTSTMVYHGYIYRMSRPLTDEYTVTAEPVENRSTRPSFTMNHLGSISGGGGGGAGGSGAVGGIGKKKEDEKKDDQPPQ